MSIRDAWKERVEQGLLIKLSFLIPGPPERRTVLMSPEVNGLVSGPWAGEEMADRCARLRADLESVLAGDRQNVCWTSFKGRTHHKIGRLFPPQDFMFDLRSVDEPGLRLLFHFAEKDVLVAHLCSPRSIPIPWLHRLPLLGKNSREWGQAIMEANAMWGELFLGFRPCEGEQIDDLLTNSVVL
jgi:hypothetical protein